MKPEFRGPDIPITPAAESSAVVGLWADYQDRMVPHSLLIESLETAAEYSEDESTLKGDYLRRQFDDFTDAVSTIPGYQGVFATGYPFYALKDDGGVHKVPEIRRYTETFIPQIEQDAARGYGAWICGACQIQTDLPDLKTFCKPCDLVDFKPRDIFKALPDLDFWVMVDAPQGAFSIVEELLEEKVRQAGFYTSDNDIVQSLDDTLHAMRTLRRGNMPGTRLPLDLHLVTRDEIFACLQQVPGALANGGNIPIRPRSLHVGWEDTDEPYDFLKDFLFSLTAQDWQDPVLWETLRAARHSAKALIGDRIIEVVANAAPKEARQLEAPALHKALKGRVAKW